MSGTSATQNPKVVIPPPPAYTTCAGTTLATTERVALAPTGAFATGYSADQTAANGCMTLADIHYDLARRSVTGGRNFLANGANAFAAFVGNGQTNTVTASYSAVLGGQGNRVAGSHSSITGGIVNEIIGGSYNQAHGYNNKLNGRYLTVSGVNNGTVTVPISGSGRWDGNAHTGGGTYLDVSGGGHRVTGSYNAVHGLGSTVASSYNTVGGYSHNVSSFGNTVGGYQQTVTANRSFSHGQSNTVGGGDSNLVSGRSNTLTGRWTTAVFGEGNNANGQYAGLIAGYFNTSAANTHVITLLGQNNNASATGGLVNAGAAAIGYQNTLTSGLAVLAFGNNNTVGSNYSGAFGASNIIPNGGQYRYAIGRAITNNTNDSVMLAGAAQRLSFYNVLPVARQTLPAVANNAQLTTALRNLGLIA